MTFLVNLIWSQVLCVGMRTFRHLSYIGGTTFLIASLAACGSSTGDAPGTAGNQATGTAGSGAVGPGGGGTGNGTAGSGPDTSDPSTCLPGIQATTQIPR